MNIEPVAYEWNDYLKTPERLGKFKVLQLKHIARRNGLRVSGTKPELTSRITVHFKTITSSVYIQSLVRRNLVISQTNARGPGLFRRELCVNETDFYTLDPISDIKYSSFFSYADQTNVIYGFDLKSLELMFDKQERLINPYNRAPFSKIVVENINRLIQLLPDEIKLAKLTDDEISRNFMNQIRDKSDDVRIRELFYYVDALGNYTQSSWFSDLSHTNLHRFITYLYELWKWRARLSREMRRNICPYFNPFIDGLEGRVSLTGINEDVLNDIDELRRVCITVMENFVYTGADEDFRKIGAMHVLTVLTHVSLDARNSIPWLYESIIF